jgi:co-chaperonin GroES (HSP10)
MRVMKMSEVQVMTDEDVDAKMPVPKGYRVLIALPKVDETYAGTGIKKSNKVIYEEYILSSIGLVMDLGDTAYQDKDRFPTGPWCKPGDYVMFRANSGTRFRFNGLEYRLMNDDSIEAVVPDPRAVTGA